MLLPLEIVSFQYSIFSLHWTYILLYTALALSPKYMLDPEVDQHVRDKGRIIDVPDLSKESRTSGAIDRVSA